MNYSGFDRSKWTPRSNCTHRDSVREVLQSTTKTQQDIPESSLECHYSCLLKLPYFIAPSMLTTDPMHNLFLRTGKHMLKLWLMHEVITAAHFNPL